MFVTKRKKRKPVRITKDGETISVEVLQSDSGEFQIGIELPEGWSVEKETKEPVLQTQPPTS
jgi:sRNA-binding carbon storage regulator CsrA